jgi:hypothetical protein
MAAPLKTLEFAAICDAVYHDGRTGKTWGFTRSKPAHAASGFHAAIFRRANGAGIDHVVAFAGSDNDADWVANPGFGGNLLSPVLAQKASHRNFQAVFGDQCGRAYALVRLARSTMGRNDRIYVTGHSLGGGLAQIAAAVMGVPAVTFSAPTVSAVSGVLEAYARNRPEIVNFRIKNDPINVTELTGRRLGTIVNLDSPRPGFNAVTAIARGKATPDDVDAHRMDLTLYELLPQGQFSVIGARDPFSFAPRQIAGRLRA